MSVLKLKQQFSDKFGGTLRVYHGIKFANESATLGSIKDDDKPSSEFLVSRNMHCGKFEKEMRDKFGIKVNVANRANTTLVPNNTQLKNSGNV